MAAPKNNQYAKGNPGGGREPFYKCSEDLQREIDAYFEKEKIPTVPGLAYHLGFCSKQSLIDYEEKEEFFFPIKRAKLQIEAFNAKALHRESGSLTGIIFTLKNLGWSDQQSIDLTTNLSQLTEEQLIIIGNHIIKQGNEKR